MKNLLYSIMLLSFLLLLTGCPKTIVNVPSTTLSGRVYNTSDESIEGIKIICGNQTTFSDNSGNFSIIVPIGTATINFSGDNFFTENRTFEVPPNPVENVRVTLCDKLENGEFLRMILSCNQEVGDLDSTLLVPKSDNDPSLGWTVYVDEGGNATGSSSDNPYAKLLNNGANQFMSSEETTIYQRFTQPYTFYVYNFSLDNLDIYPGYPDSTFFDSDATVRIYGTNGLIDTVEVTSDGTDVYWYILDIDANGNLSIINELLKTEPTLN